MAQTKKKPKSPKKDKASYELNISISNTFKAFAVQEKIIITGTTQKLLYGIKRAIQQNILTIIHKTFVVINVPYPWRKAVVKNYT